MFPEFNEICHDHITDHPELSPQDFDSFEQECLSQDALALVEYALDLQAQGCTIDLAGSSGRRALQNSYLSQWLDSDERTCDWDEVDDYAHDVDLVCCGEDGSQCPNGRAPDSCNEGCAISMHQFTTDCAGTLDVVMPSGDDRRTQIDSFESMCLSSLDPEFFLHAIMAATGPDGGPCVPEFNGGGNSGSSGGDSDGACFSSPCQNGGVCAVAGTFGTEFTCTCDLMYMGDNCQTANPFGR